MSQALAEAKKILSTLPATDETKQLEELAATIEAKIDKQADTGSTPAPAPSSSSSSSSSASSPSSSSQAASASKDSSTKVTQASSNKTSPSFLSGFSGLFGTSNKPAPRDEAVIQAAVSNLNPSDVAAFANLATPENLARLVQPPSASSPAVVQQKQDIPELIASLKDKTPKEQFDVLKRLKFDIPPRPTNEAAKKEWDNIVTQSNDVDKTTKELINGKQSIDDANIGNLKTGIRQLNGALEAFKYTGADQADGRDEQFRVYTQKIGELNNFITNSKPPTLFQAYEGYNNLLDSYEKLVIAAQSAKDIVISKDADQKNFTRDLNDFNARYAKFVSQKLLYYTLMEEPIMKSITSGNLKKALAQDQRTATFPLIMSRDKEKNDFELNRKMQAIKDALKFNGAEYPRAEIDEYNTAMVSYNSRQGKKTPEFFSVEKITEDLGKGKTPIQFLGAIIKNIKPSDDKERVILELVADQQSPIPLDDAVAEGLLNLSRNPPFALTPIPARPGFTSTLSKKNGTSWDASKFYGLYAKVITTFYSAQGEIKEKIENAEKKLEAAKTATPYVQDDEDNAVAELETAKEKDARKDKEFIKSYKNYENAIILWNDGILTSAEKEALVTAKKAVEKFKGGKRTSRKNRKGKPSKRQSRRRPHKVQVAEA